MLGSTSVAFGVMWATQGAGTVAIPDTVAVAPLPPVKATACVFVPGAVGVYRAVTDWLWPAPRLYGLPETTLKGAATLAAPESVPDPTF